MSLPGEGDGVRHPRQSSSDGYPPVRAIADRIPSNCNRACWFCPRTYDRSGKYLDAAGKSVLRQMPTEKILGLLDEAQGLGFSGMVGFHHYSEPLLDPRNITLAREAIRRGMAPYLHTNGDVLRRSDALCDGVRQVYALIVVGTAHSGNLSRRGRSEPYLPHGRHATGWGSFPTSPWATRTCCGFSGQPMRAR
jgi:hypothetical protein